MESRESQQSGSSMGQSEQSEKGRKISFKKALKQALEQRPGAPQDMPPGMEKFIRHGLLVHTAMILIHKGRIDEYSPKVVPEHIREFLRSADRKTLQGILLEALFCEFERLDEEE